MRRTTDGAFAGSRWFLRASRSLIAVMFLLAFAGSAHADSAVAELSVDGRAYAGMPFGIKLTVDGFDESPAPKFPSITIAGAKVVENGITPSVSRNVTIFNGQRQDKTVVRWVLSWKVTADREGTLTIPSLTVSQGTKQATAKGGGLEVATVPSTDDMKLEIGLPARAIWVGESVPVEITWLLKRDVSEQNFQIPLLSMPDDFVVSAPPATDPRKSLPFPTGRGEVRLPFVQDETDVNGVHYSRLRFTALLAPRRAGKISVPASTVMAEMAFGRPDIFGNAPTRLFRATDVARTLDVKELPQANRPSSFWGAVGTSFSISATTSRSVVQQGEPLELAVTIKSDQRLDALSLGKLDGAGGLPSSVFTVPTESPPGELSDDGKSKIFRLSVQVLATTKQLPALSFSYFDPAKAEYATIHSEPIALSVTSGTVVSANDVVASKPNGASKQLGSASASTAPLSLVGADFTLSTAGRTATSLPPWIVWAVIALLYVVPLANLVLRRRRIATAGARLEAGEVRAARDVLSRELKRAKQSPARDVAGSVVTALRTLGKLCDRDNDAREIIAKIEDESFSPAAAKDSLSSAVVARITEASTGWRANDKKRGRADGATVAMLLIVGASLLVHGNDAQAADVVNTDGEQALVTGRAEYQAAMSQPEATARQQAFARAAAQLSIASRGATSPDVLTDWGNAALGAGDVAFATLAFRRALLLDANNGRAKQNLSWLRSRQPENMRLGGAGATETLLFFHPWPRMRKLLVGAAAFALAILLITPWRGRRRRSSWALAMIPAVVWLGMTVSILLARAATDDAVLVDGVILRAADNAGAPAALPDPLPRGIEVTIETVRDGWVRIVTANGSKGWVPAAAVERVSPLS
jgi:hypothetical protein